MSSIHPEKTSIVSALASGVGRMADATIEAAAEAAALVALTDATIEAAAAAAEADARSFAARLLAFRKLGFHPVPVTSPSAGGPSAGKAPRIPGWQKVALTATADTYSRWARDYPDHRNIGFVCENIVGIDIDIDDPVMADAIDDLCVRHFGMTIMRRRDNSARRLAIYRIDGPAWPKRVIAGVNGKVERLGAANQFVAFGLHPSGAALMLEYGGCEVPDPGPVAALPLIAEAQFADFEAEALAALGGPSEKPAASNVVRLPVRHAGTTGQDHLAVPDKACAVALVRVMALLPNDSAFDDRRRWTGLAHAIAAALADYPDVARKVWLKFCAKRDQREGEPERAWDTLPTPHEIGAEWIIERAQEAVARGATAGVDVEALAGAVAEYEGAALGSEFAPGELLDTKDAPPDVLRLAGVLAPTAKQPGAADDLSLDQMTALADAKKKRTFTVELARDFVPRTSPELVSGWFGAGELGGLIGAPGSYKTTVAADLACSIAHGVEWMGCRTRQGAVLVIELEGAAGLRHRVLGWHADRGLDKAAAPLGMICDGVALGKADDVEGLVAAARAFGVSVGRHRLALIVIDTLARSAGGLDENKAGDMGVLIEAMDRLRRETGAAVLVIHHTGLAADDRARGSSAFRGALDVEILVERAKGKDGGPPPAAGAARAVKMRERETPMPLGFEVEAVELIGADGEPIATADGKTLTAAVTRRGHLPAKLPKPLTGLSAVALKCLTDAIDAHGEALPAGEKYPPSGRGVQEEKWREDFYKSLPADKTQEARKKSFQRVHTALIAADRIGTFDGWIWLPGQPGAEFSTEDLPLSGLTTD